MDLKQIRIGLGLSQKDFSSITKIPQGNISAIESGKRTLTNTQIILIEILVYMDKINILDDYLKEKGLT